MASESLDDDAEKPIFFVYAVGSARRAMIALLVRGSARDDGFDPMYCCVTDRETGGRYAVLSIDAQRGHVLQCKTVRPRHIDKVCTSVGASRMYVDGRALPSLLPVPPCVARLPRYYDGSEMLAQLRRAHDESARSRLVRAHKIARAAVEGRWSPCTFRRRCRRMRLRSFARREEDADAIRLRYGVRYRGLCSSEATVHPKTRVASARVGIVVEALARARRALVTGAAFAGVESECREWMAERGVDVVGRLVRGIGFDVDEPLPQQGAVQEGDAFTVCAVFAATPDGPLTCMIASLHLA